MRTRPLVALAFGFAIVVWGSLSGCSSDRMSQEMKHQEQSMANENDAWQMDIQRWKSENFALLSEVGAKPVGSDSSLAKHYSNLTEHARKLTDFENEFKSHQGKIQEEASMPEKNRITEHAGLLAEHSKLKIEHDLLAAAHEDLKGQNAQIVSTSSTRP